MEFDSKGTKIGHFLPFAKKYKLDIIRSRRRSLRSMFSMNKTNFRALRCVQMG